MDNLKPSLDSKELPKTPSWVTKLLPKSSTQFNLHSPEKAKLEAKSSVKSPVPLYPGSGKIIFEPFVKLDAKAAVYTREATKFFNQNPDILEIFCKKNYPNHSLISKRDIATVYGNSGDQNDGAKAMAIFDYIQKKTTRNQNSNKVEYYMKPKQSPKINPRKMEKENEKSGLILIEGNAPKDSIFMQNCSPLTPERTMTLKSEKQKSQTQEVEKTQLNKSSISLNEDTTVNMPKPCLPSSMERSIMFSKKIPSVTKEKEKKKSKPDAKNGSFLGVEMSTGLISGPVLKEEIQINTSLVKVDPRKAKKIVEKEEKIDKRMKKSKLFAKLVRENDRLWNKETKRDAALNKKGKANAQPENENFDNQEIIVNLADEASQQEAQINADENEVKNEDKSIQDSNDAEEISESEEINLIDFYQDEEGANKDEEVVENNEKDKEADKSEEVVENNEDKDKEINKDAENVENQDKEADKTEEVVENNEKLDKEENENIIKDAEDDKKEVPSNSDEKESHENSENEKRCVIEIIGEEGGDEKEKEELQKEKRRKAIAERKKEYNRNKRRQQAEDSKRQRESMKMVDSAFLSKIFSTIKEKTDVNQPAKAEEEQKAKTSNSDENEKEKESEMKITKTNIDIPRSPIFIDDDVTDSDDDQRISSQPITKQWLPKPSKSMCFGEVKRSSPLHSSSSADNFKEEEEQLSVKSQIKGLQQQSAHPKIIEPNNLFLGKRMKDTFVNSKDLIMRASPSAANLTSPLKTITRSVSMSQLRKSFLSRTSDTKAIELKPVKQVNEKSKKKKVDVPAFFTKEDHTNEEEEEKFEKLDKEFLSLPDKVIEKEMKIGKLFKGEPKEWSAPRARPVTDVPLPPNFSITSYLSVDGNKLKEIAKNKKESSQMKLDDFITSKKDKKVKEKGASKKKAKSKSSNKRDKEGGADASSIDRSETLNIIDAMFKVKPPEASDYIKPLKMTDAFEPPKKNQFLPDEE